MFKGLLILLIGCLLVGCVKKEPNTNNADLVKVIADLKVEVESLKSAEELRKLVSNIEAVAFLRVGTTAFSSLKTDIGTITVNISDIKPYANGSKVKLTFGNPLNADLTGVKFVIDYGELNEDKYQSIKEGTERTKEISLNKELKKGTWNKEEIILEGLSDKKLGYVRIHDLTFTQIYLFTGR
jgi:hypothetical protein